MKTPLKSGHENDVIYGRHIYRYLQNNPKIVKFIKRKINKRIRKQADKEILDQLLD